MNGLELNATAWTTSGKDIKGAVDDLVWLLSEYEFSGREFKIAGVDIELIKKWTLALTLLTDK